MVADWTNETLSPRDAKGSVQRCVEDWLSGWVGEAQIDMFGCHCYVASIQCRANINAEKKRFVLVFGFQLCDQNRDLERLFGGIKQERSPSRKRMGFRLRKKRYRWCVCTFSRKVLSVLAKQVVFCGLSADGKKGFELQGKESERIGVPVNCFSFFLSKVHLNFLFGKVSLSLQQHLLAWNSVYSFFPLPCIRKKNIFELWNEL